MPWMILEVQSFRAIHSENLRWKKKELTILSFAFSLGLSEILAFDQKFLD
jgi:hypothetical protein